MQTKLYPFALSAAVLLLLVCPAAHAQSLQLTPGSVLIDQTTSIRAAGLAPGATVTISADLVDGRDQPWASTADFQADAQGNVDVSTQAPVRGSYRGVSAMGLIWSMRPTA